MNLPPYSPDVQACNERRLNLIKALDYFYVMRGYMYWLIDDEAETCLYTLEGCLTFQIVKFSEEMARQIKAEDDAKDMPRAGIEPAV